MGKANPWTPWILNVGVFMNPAELLRTYILGHTVTCLRAMPRLLILTLLIDMGAIAAIDLYITQPTHNFATSNQTLVVEGGVKSSEQEDIIVTISAPAGDLRLPTIMPSIHAIAMDLGDVQQLHAVQIRPSVDGESPMGPRRIFLAVSEDGTQFAENFFDVPANLDDLLNRVILRFPNPTAARFIRMEMLDGWEPDRILIESVELLGIDNQIIQPSIGSVSILLEHVRDRDKTFAIELLLSEGENEISVVASPLSAPATAQDIETIAVRYLADLQSAVPNGSRFELSDGNQARLLVPVDALDSSIKKIRFFRESPGRAAQFDYNDNTRIAQGTLPVFVYRFEVLKRGNFMVEATSYLSSQPPALAVDGILEPPSTWMAGLVPLPIHLTVDLGDFHTLAKIVVHSNVVGNRSFGPQRGTILVSNDNLKFSEVMDVSAFNDGSTDIELPSHVTCRYVRLLITESKQANNVQLNEVQFYDAFGSKILRLVAFNQFLLEGPALLEFRYGRADLERAGVDRAADLRVFTWNPSTYGWQLAGGEVDPIRQTVRIELNYISRFAVFQAAPPRALAAHWSLNPFSPDGNGVADITRLMIPDSGEASAGQRDLVVEIYDLRSKLVKTLINRSAIDSNSISIEWDGTDRTGKPVNIGPYIYQVRLGSQISNGVIVVAK